MIDPTLHSPCLFVLTVAVRFQNSGAGMLPFERAGGMRLRIPQRLKVFFNVIALNLDAKQLTKTHWKSIVGDDLQLLL